MQIQTIQLVSIFAMGFILSCCNSQSPKFKMESKPIYYKYFDIFKLSGTDSLRSIDKKQSVEVTYSNNYPISIKFYTPKRTVTLVFEDSFSINNNPIYLYSTSNFHGGQPGRNRVYASHYEEYRDLIYLSRSDTIICQTETVPKDGNFSFHLYVKKTNGDIEKISKGEFDYDGENAKLNRSQLYLKGLNFLRDDYLKGKRKPEIKQTIPE